MLRMNGARGGMPTSSAVARLATGAATARKIADVLAESFEGGAVSVFEEADGGWALALHFRAAPDHAAVRAAVAAAAGASTAAALVFETLAPTDWVHRSLEGLAPVAAGRFTVHGAHDRGRVQANCVGIEIEAALAFGTGHHDTTRGCLLALDRILKGRSPRTILDVGTGTGVLAIAAAKALRRPVLASDIDARAVATARDNARANRVAAHVRVIHAAGVAARPFRARGPFALVFANILLEPLERLATPLSRLVAPNGRIVLSGLLAAQANPALASYRARGLVLERRIRLGGWVTLVLARSSRSGRA
jgi:ribosomal protein L11 methyltransferase